ncbi:hypothetical protein J1605_003727 [Eschrichtius robustus]|uniref:Protein ripply3 n=1 Tax=Eschrichtius robustus TaxID=9764 RepID=A0AB34HKR9_ESCRO|nr:hypothetical protein J1605_003727 [Eschrichtius robustus]
MQSSCEKVLASFPVQATIHFCSDESDSDEEQEEETLQCQKAGGGPGGKGRDRLTNPGDNGNPETMAASVVRVCSPALTLRGWCVTLIQISLSLLHQTHLTCALGDSPWGQPCQDTLRFHWVYKSLTVSGQHPTLGKDSAFTRPSPGDFWSLIYTFEKGF